METIQQLEEKLREKLKALGPKLNMEVEKRLFLDVIETCVGLLVQDLYSACEPVLASMNKVLFIFFSMHESYLIFFGPIFRQTGNSWKPSGIRVATFLPLLLNGVSLFQLCVTFLALLGNTLSSFVNNLLSVLLFNYSRREYYAVTDGILGSIAGSSWENLCQHFTNART